MPRPSQSRFTIRGEDGEIGFIKYTHPDQALSRALNMASNGTGPATWEVVEYEDVIYRVHRLDTEDKKLDVRVEVIRS